MSSILHYGQHHDGGSSVIFSFFALILFQDEGMFSLSQIFGSVVAGS